MLRSNWSIWAHIVNVSSATKVLNCFQQILCPCEQLSTISKSQTCQAWNHPTLQMLPQSGHATLRRRISAATFFQVPSYLADHTTLQYLPKHALVEANMFQTPSTLCVCNDFSKALAFAATSTGSKVGSASPSDCAKAPRKSRRLTFESSSVLI